MMIFCLLFNYRVPILEAAASYRTNTIIIYHCADFINSSVKVNTNFFAIKAIRDKHN